MVSPRSVGVSSRRSKVQEGFAIPRESEGARGGRRGGRERSRSRKIENAQRGIIAVVTRDMRWRHTDGKEGKWPLFAWGAMVSSWAEAKQGEIQERYERVEGAASSRV